MKNEVRKKMKNDKKIEKNRKMNFFVKLKFFKIINGKNKNRRYT